MLPDSVTDVAGNALDGEWDNGTDTYNSGDGAAGGDFAFRIDILPGDVNQVGDTVFRQPGLSRTEQFAGSAQFQVSLRDQEAVVGIAQNAQSRPGHLSERLAIEHYAVTLRCATANPAAGPSPGPAS